MFKRPRGDKSDTYKKVSDPTKYLQELNERFNTSIIQDVEVLVDAFDVVFYRYACLRCYHIHVRRYTSFVNASYRSPSTRGLCLKQYANDMKKKQNTNLKKKIAKSNTFRLQMPNLYFDGIWKEKITLKLEFSDSETEN
jgi:hypothetical protein